MYLDAIFCFKHKNDVARNKKIYINYKVDFSEPKSLLGNLRKCIYIIIYLHYFIKDACATQTKLNLKVLGLLVMSVICGKCSIRIV